MCAINALPFRYYSPWLYEVESALEWLVKFATGLNTVNRHGSKPWTMSIMIFTPVTNLMYHPSKYGLQSTDSVCSYILELSTLLELNSNFGFKFKFKFGCALCRFCWEFFVFVFNWGGMKPRHDSRQGSLAKKWRTRTLSKI